MYIRWQLAAMVAIPLLLGTASAAFGVSQMRHVTDEQEEALGHAGDVVASAERLRGLATQGSAQLMGYMRGATSLDELNLTRAAFEVEAERLRASLPAGHPVDVQLSLMREAERGLLAPPAGAEGDLFATIAAARAAQTYVFNDSDVQFYRLSIFYDAFGNDTLNRTSGPVWSSLGYQRSGITEFEYALNAGQPIDQAMDLTRSGHVGFVGWYVPHMLVRLAETEAALPSGDASQDARAAIDRARDAIAAYDANGSVAHARSIEGALKAVGNATEAAGAPQERAGVGFPPYVWTLYDTMGATLVAQHKIQAEATRFFDLSIALQQTMEGSLTTRAAEMSAAAEAAVLASQDEATLAGARVDRAIEQTQWTVLGAVALALIPSGTASILVARRISRRLHSFDHAAGEVGRGEFQVPPPPPEQDEFDALADSWATMTGALAAREAEIRQKNNALVASERLASVGSLIAGVAHEVNNPLAFVKANEELVADDLRALLDREAMRADPEVMRVLEDAISAMQANREGIERVEQVSLALKGLSGPARERTLLDINAVSEGILILAHASLRNKIRVERRYSTVPKVIGESRELGQIVLNLVLNAAQVAPPQSALEIITRYDDGYVYLTVKDEGPGVPDEVRGRLFEAFVTTKEGGTGLGLHLSREIARSHGGDLYLEETAEGAAFTLRLPQGESTRVAAPARAETAPVAQAPMPRAR